MLGKIAVTGATGTTGEHGKYGKDGATGPATADCCKEAIIYAISKVHQQTVISISSLNTTIKGNVTNYVAGSSIIEVDGSKGANVGLNNIAGETIEPVSGKFFVSAYNIKLIRFPTVITFTDEECDETLDCGCNIELKTAINGIIKPIIKSDESIGNNTLNIDVVDNTTV